jgi:uncharacterized protein YcbX
VDAVVQDGPDGLDQVPRFRPNLVVDGVAPFAEEQWIGRRLRIGTAVLHVETASPRCVMVDHATADLPARPGLLRDVGRLNRTRLGVVASVVQRGRSASATASSSSRCTR